MGHRHRRRGAALSSCRPLNTFLPIIWPLLADEYACHRSRHISVVVLISLVQSARSDRASATSAVWCLLPSAAMYTIHRHLLIYDGEINGLPAKPNDLHESRAHTYKFIAM